MRMPVAGAAIRPSHSAVAINSKSCGLGETAVMIALVQPFLNDAVINVDKKSD